MPFITFTKSDYNSYRLDFYTENGIHSACIDLEYIEPLLNDLRDYYHAQLEYYIKNGMEKTEERYSVVENKEMLGHIIDLLESMKRTKAIHQNGMAFVCVERKNRSDE